MGYNSSKMVDIDVNIGLAKFNRAFLEHYLALCERSGVRPASVAISVEQGKTFINWRSAPGSPSALGKFRIQGKITTPEIAAEEAFKALSRS